MMGNKLPDEGGEVVNKMTASLSRAQVDALLRPIAAHRVFSLDGQSHVPAYDVAAHLTRVFGFGGWDKEVLSLNLVREFETQLKNGKAGWQVTYSCTLRLTIKNEFGVEVARWEDGSCGTSTQPQYGEAHDMALKSAISYALKRCAAFGLGDQFGLSLYNKGSKDLLVGNTLVLPEGELSTVDLQAKVPTAQSIGNDEKDGGNFETPDEPIAALVALLTGSSFTGKVIREIIEAAVGHTIKGVSAEELTPEEIELSITAINSAIADRALLEMQQEGEKP